MCHYVNLTGVSVNSQWTSSAQNNTAAGVVYNNSYYGAHQVAPHPGAAPHQTAAPGFGQRPQRQLHDIVSSMQGSFHFLQESQIELDSKNLFVMLGIILSAAFSCVKRHMKSCTGNWLYAATSQQQQPVNLSVTLTPNKSNYTHLSRLKCQFVLSLYWPSFTAVQHQVVIAETRGPIY